ncbi:GNAT family N-acetyltransferase [Flavobacterium sp. xlx-214]|uniref:GNAT family N-acetyltransferase n=1 Tax=unclassified Flavobacterium TaxID=196869 RepID=UPI0013D4F8CC|nr:MULTISPECIES: GNAT family N-acetyltransferase [unclassified Flavobacterium]MBA5793626.1 GNAT family N-acetyltransferase [Flavobacterium sp. xlx-221]QMI84555.1 GNAT family N-acetyltransferase [Flavobacterium sp. xlx-214]
MDVTFEQVKNTKEFPYELLLLADETVEAINKYLFQSAVYVVKTNKQTIGVFCLYPLNNDEVELKNIAVSNELQGKGIGTQILNFIKNETKNKYQTLIVGTPDCAVRQLHFYKKNGFEVYSIRKNFFIDHYEKPIIENGIQLKDMVLLKYHLKQ